MPLDQQGWRRPDYKMNTSVVGVVSKSMMLRLRDPFTTSFSLSLACCATEQSHSRCKEQAHTHTAHVHFSLVCRIIPYQATASAADPMSEPQESSSPIPPTPRSVSDLRKTWCSLATTAIVAFDYSVTRCLRNTQCPRSARTVPAQCPRQCPPGK